MVLRTKQLWGDEVSVRRMSEKEVIRLEFPVPRTIAIFVNWKNPSPNRSFRLEIGERGVHFSTTLARGVHVVHGRNIRVVAVNRDTFGESSTALGWAALSNAAPTWMEFDPLSP